MTKRLIAGKLAVLFSLLLFAGLLGHAADVPFNTSNIITTDTLAVRSVFAADLDGDSDLDVISASPDDNKLAWFENVDGAGTFGTENIITTGGLEAYNTTAADIDNDGDLDVLLGSRLDSETAWFENLDGAGTFGPANFITTAASFVQSVNVADFDKDGDLDAVTASADDNRIAWYENTNGQGTYGAQQTLTTAASAARYAIGADLDGDGDQDIVSASSDDDTISWFENTDGAGTFSSRINIDTTMNGAAWVEAADLDNDSDLDLLACTFDSGVLAWYENTDGDATFAPRQQLDSPISVPRIITTSDLDLDGDLDIIMASNQDDIIAWHENIDDATTFTLRKVISNTIIGPFSIYPADLDKDGDEDLLYGAAQSNTVGWLENKLIHRSGAYPVRDVISTDTIAIRSVYAADLDGDGDLDTLSASPDDNKVAWYENIDGAASYGPQQVITTSAMGAYYVTAADIDCDGDQDVLSASRADSRLIWYENTDGTGNFSSGTNITTLASFAQSVHAADIDGDGDYDTVSASADDNRVAWYENTDGAGTFGPQQTLTTSASRARHAITDDIDGDGDLDIIQASSGDDTVSWFENTDGTGTFGSEQLITNLADGATWVDTGDLDGDGDIDVLSAEFNAGANISWYENTDGAGTFGAKMQIGPIISTPRNVFAVDLDLDGDLDVMLASNGDNTLAWHENLDGAATWSDRKIISDNELGIFDIIPADLDNDGDLDILFGAAQGNTIGWFLNRGGQTKIEAEDIAPTFIIESEKAALLQLNAVHEGAPGDNNAELVTLEFLFEEADDDALTTGEANAIIENFGIWRDTGSGDFEETSDTLVLQVNTLNLDSSGTLTMNFADGDPNVELQPNVPVVFFAVVELTADAKSQDPDMFQVTYLADGANQVEDKEEDITLTNEFTFSVTSSSTLTVPVDLSGFRLE
jgi:hypothetical protein